jgi:SAM-dependent methyltransferase
MHSYELDPSVAEIYDQIETQTEDVALLRRLIGAQHGLRILESFCGTGRILLPLAADGHMVDGLDWASPMLERARAKLAQIPPAAQERVRLVHRQVLFSPWPGDYDLVILGGNCLYELATPQQQEMCIRQAAQALRTGGYLFVDSDHMEGELDPGWLSSDIQKSFPCGTCADGTRVEGTRQTVWHDMPRRLVLFSREIRITRPDGSLKQQAYLEQKHPVSHDEVAGWIEANGLVIRATYGGHDERPYTPDAPRAIFWAQKV